MGNADPATINRAMHVAKKQMTNSGSVRRDYFSKRLFVDQANTVQGRYVYVKRRVVHKQENRLPFMVLQLRVKPLASFFAIRAGMGPCLDGIEHQEGASRCWHRVLNKAIFVDRLFGKLRLKQLATIMIADQQMTGYCTSIEFAPQNSVRIGVSGIGQITSNDAALGVSMKLVDVVEKGD